VAAMAVAMAAVMAAVMAVAAVIAAVMAVAASALAVAEAAAAPVAAAPEQQQMTSYLRKILCPSPESARIIDFGDSPKQQQNTALWECNRVYAEFWADALSLHHCGSVASSAPTELRAGIN
jgi:hypothetical protein